MKKIIMILLTLTLGLASISPCMADYSETVKTAQSQNAGTYSVSVSSVIAIQVRPENITRSGIEINNISAYTIYLATYAATASTNLYDIVAGAKFSDNLEPFTGIWYLLLQSGQSAQSIKVVEKWSD